MLRDLRPLEVEIPGQYLTGSDTQPESHVKLEYIGADVLIVRRHGSGPRRLAFVGRDGKEHLFLVQTTTSPFARTDERLIQLMRHFNHMLDKHKQTKRRKLFFHTCTVVPVTAVIAPVWSQVRLFEEEPSYSSYGETYEINCARYGREADIPVTFFKDALNVVFTKEVQGDQEKELRLNTYREVIISGYVSDNVFSQFLYKTLAQGNHLWMFKKQFMAQWALSCFLAAILHLGNRTPNKILFAKNTGNVLQLEFRPQFDQNGSLDKGEHVPFRLTRNLQNFFSPAGVEGPFVTFLSTAAQAFTAPHSSIDHHLALFFRDELMTWPPMKHKSRTSTDAMVHRNVETVVSNIKSMLPVAPTLRENTQLPRRSVQKGVLDLLESALNPENICRMDPTWHPWF
eukprot:CAMPEP_0197867066 /NCGR_PEP_ID=MMETSP1438-20131217/44556_1 /TAXON_ID=1461541 /ORGANISM="Pterosperma sp., Strain CCMP1384" /LENGTH=398 /DNA_ID=CAMNT_0043485685 /DNA_START=424 /DNA_END=1620 /DNA_ORIENTATION=+